MCRTVNPKGKVNTLFLCIFGVSLIAHAVALAYMQLPVVRQAGPLAVRLIMRDKPRPPKPPPKPEPVPVKKLKPVPVKKLKPVKQKNILPPRQMPQPVQERPPVPLKAEEPQREVAMAPVARVVVEPQQGASEAGSEHGQPGGAPGGKGREPAVAPPEPPPPRQEPPPPQIDTGDLWRQYKIKVVSRIQGVKQYPPRARSRGETGAASVRFTVSASGAVSGVSLAKSSGHSVLDEEAVNAVHRAAPFPPFPVEIKESSQTMSVTLKFEIR